MALEILEYKVPIARKMIFSSEVAALSELSLWLTCDRSAFFEDNSAVFVK